MPPWPWYFTQYEQSPLNVGTVVIFQCLLTHSLIKMAQGMERGMAGLEGGGIWTFLLQWRWKLVAVLKWTSGYKSPSGLNLDMPDEIVVVVAVVVIGTYEILTDNQFSKFWFAFVHLYGLGPEEGLSLYIYIYCAVGFFRSLWWWFSFGLDPFISFLW